MEICQATKSQEELETAFIAKGDSLRRPEPCGYSYETFQQNKGESKDQGPSGEVEEEG